MKYIFVILFSLIGFLTYSQTIHNPYDGSSFDTTFTSNIHFHTIESDGDQTVYERIVGNAGGNPPGYIDKDYRILSIADHDSYSINPVGQFTGVQPTFPWHIYTNMTGYTPTVVYGGDDSTSIYYGGLNDGTFAIMGNELTGCQEDNNYYTHMNAYFCDVGWADCPSGGFDTYLDSIKSKGGMALFNHPGRHAANAAFYNDYFDRYNDELIGIEIYNAGDYRPTQNPRILWDSINSARDADDLIWGMSNSDIHQSYFDDTTDMWKNYNIHFVDTLTEADIRTNFTNGAFTAHWAGIFNDFGTDDDWYPTPRLTAVDVAGSVITLTATNCDSIRWIGSYSDTLLTDTAIDVSSYVDDNNFVRAELYLDGYITHTQPFGIEAAANPYGGDHFVATDGDDAAAGTFSAPWRTWQKAFDNAVPGDTIYFRGGTYYSDSVNYIDPENEGGPETNGDGVSGTYENPICYWAYPGETPILDCINHGDNMEPGPGSEIVYNYALFLVRVEHLHFKGLTIQHVLQHEWSDTIQWAGNTGAVRGWFTANLTFENFTIRNCSNKAFHIISGAYNSWDWDTDVTPWVDGFDYDTTLFVNVDTYNLCDSLSAAYDTPDVSGSGSGNHADCYKMEIWQNTYYKWSGCRLWNFSDDGWDFNHEAYKIIEDSWVMASDKYAWTNSFEGNGSKLTQLDSGQYWVDSLANPNDTIFAQFNRCLFLWNTFAIYNDLYINQGLYGKSNNTQFYNNTFYGNDYGPWTSMITGDTICTTEFKNNIAWGATEEDCGQPVEIMVPSGAWFSESNNTFDYKYIDGSCSRWEYSTNPTMSDADFSSIDSMTIVNLFTAERQADGSLPAVKPLSLASTSDLIDAGVDVGFTYSGAAQDIGAFESNYSNAQYKLGASGGKPIIDASGNLMRYNIE